MFVFQPLFSAVEQRLTFFASPKKVSKERRLPRSRRAYGTVPCAARSAGWFAKLAYGSNIANQLPPADLRCSALAREPERRRGETGAPGKWEHAARNVSESTRSIAGLIGYGGSVHPSPSRAPSSAEMPAGVGSRCLSRRRVSRTGRQLEQHREPGQRPGANAGVAFLCFLSLAKQRKGDAAQRRKTAVQPARQPK